MDKDDLKETLELVRELEELESIRVLNSNEYDRLKEIKRKRENNNDSE